MTNSVKLLDFKTGSVSDHHIVNSFVYDDFKISLQQINLVLRAYLSNKRSGNAKVKTMAEISGTTAKPHKQKGTGRARQGSKRSVQFVGGRTCFGPSGEQNYSISVPKTLRKNVIKYLIKDRFDNAALSFFKSDGIDISTKNVSKIMKQNSLDGKVMFVLNDKTSDNFIKSARNIEGVKISFINGINVHDLLNHEHLVFEIGAIDKIN